MFDLLQVFLAIAHNAPIWIAVNGQNTTPTFSNEYLTIPPTN